MALDENEMSEHVELLSDAADFGNEPDMRPLDKAGDADPLVEAALAVHEKQQQQQQQKEDKPNNPEAAPLIEDDMLDLKRNSLQIPSSCRSLQCAISWEYSDAAKVSKSKVCLSAARKAMLSDAVVLSLDSPSSQSLTLELSAIPLRCSSLWLSLRAPSGESLQNICRAQLAMSDDSDDAAAADDSALYSVDVDMGFDCAAVLLGVLYRDADKGWRWSVVEQKDSSESDGRHGCSALHSALKRVFCVCVSFACRRVLLLM